MGVVWYQSTPFVVGLLELMLARSGRGEGSLRPLLEAWHDRVTRPAQPRF